MLSTANSNNLIGVSTAPIPLLNNEDKVPDESILSAMPPAASFAKVGIMLLVFCDCYVFLASNLLLRASWPLASPNIICST